jgi:hypothetical protein
MKHFAFGLMTFFVLAPLHAQWTKTSSANWGTTNQILVVDNPAAGSILFSLADSGLFSSNDNAVTWIHQPIDSTKPKILSLTHDGASKGTT